MLFYLFESTFEVFGLSFKSDGW